MALTTISEIQATASPNAPGVFTRLDDIKTKNEEQAKKDNNYINMLDNDYDRVKADSNNDGKVDYTEYKSFLVNKNEEKPSILQSKIQEDNNNNTNHNYYHFDYSLLIAIGMVCFTTILVTWINKKKMK